MNNEPETNILSEHAGVVLTRHIMAILNFIFIFVGTIVTVVFVNRRGVAPEISAVLYTLLAVNIFQIIACVTDFIAKRYFGVYIRPLVFASYIIGALWLVLLIAEVVISSLSLGNMRIDLLIILCAQLVMAAVAYFVWPLLDKHAVEAMTNVIARADKEKRASQRNKYIRLYIILCVAIMVGQVLVLFLYKMPPKIYDLFDENRAIEYELTEDGTGYVVKGVYRGTSDKVNIPAEYNNKPVVGIAENALNDDSILNKYKVNSIVFGTPEKDANGNEVMVSNLQYIESGAISNDKITELTIPSAVVSIGMGAIKSSSLKRVIYSAQANFAIGYLDCPTLSTITMEGEQVGNIVSLDGMSKNVTIDVSKDIYNEYRRDNFEYVNNFHPILDDDEICLDFYTNSNEYYLNSIIGKASQGIQIGYSDLVNREIAGPGISVDTLAYIRNKRETGTNGVRQNSAFRGWYFDSSFQKECEFREDSKLSFYTNTAIYAKWIEEFHSNLTWGYHPAGTPETVYWTSEDAINFPTYLTREGYSGGLRWYTVDSHTELRNSYNLERSVDLRAEWILDAPAVDIDSKLSGAPVANDYDVTFTYDETHQFTMTPIKTHALGNSIRYAYEWYKDGRGSIYSTLDEVLLENVADSGMYIVKVTATAPDGETASTERTVNVHINRKPIDMGDVVLNSDTKQYSGKSQRIRYEGTPRTTNIQTTYTYYLNEGKLGSDGVIDVGAYRVVALFEKNNEREAANYETKTLQADFTITPVELRMEAWECDGAVLHDDKLTYDGKAHTVTMTINKGDIIGSDSVNLIYGGDYNEIRANKYTAVVTGVDNPNYSVKEIGINLTYEWEIAQKEVTIAEWRIDTDKVSSRIYDGKAHTAQAILDGAISNESVNFVYDSTASCRITGTAADSYRSRVSGVNNPDYIFIPDNDENHGEFNWTIARRPLNVTFSQTEGHTFDYKGADWDVSASISGIVDDDLDLINQNMFDTEGSEIGSISGERALGNYLIYFRGKNAGNYTATVAGLKENEYPMMQNYSITSKSLDFHIAPKLISFNIDREYTYNGKTQDLRIVVKDIVPSDLADISYNNFIPGSVDTAKPDSGKKEGQNYVLIYQRKEAGEYNISISKFTNGNYTLGGVEYNTALEIKKAKLQVASWQIRDNNTSVNEPLRDMGSKPYNRVGYTVTAVLSGIQSSSENTPDAVALTYEGEMQTEANTRYTTSCSLGEDWTDNYELAEENTSVGWSITPLELEIEWKLDDTAFTIPAGIESPYNAENQIITYRLKNVIEGDSVDIKFFGSCDFNKKDVGSYYVSMESTTGEQAADYKVPIACNFIWKITAVAVDVTVESGNSVYNGKYVSPTVKLGGTGLDVLYSDIANNADAAFTLKSVVNDNDKTLALVSGQSDYTYTGAARFAIDVGTYNLSSFEIRKDGIGDKNYTVNYSQVSSFEITPKELSIGQWQYAVESGEKTAVDSGSFVYNKKTYTLTASISEDSLCDREGTGKDELQLSYTGNIGMNVQQYEARISGLTGTYCKNYSIPVENSTLNWSITPKRLIVVWDEQTFTYDGTEQIRTAHVEGETTGDDDGKYYTGDGDMTLTFADNRQVGAGTYTAKVTGVGNKNYYIDVDADTSSKIWSIGKKVIETLVWDKTSFTYNGERQHPKATYSFKSDSVEVTEYDGQGECDANDGSSSYRIKAIAINNDNYTLDGTSNAEVEYNIGKLKIALTWAVENEAGGFGNLVYNGKDRKAVATVSNRLNSDEIILTYEINSLSGNTFRDAGEYTVSVVSVSNNNYMINGKDSDKKTFTVQQRAVVLAWRYDGEEAQKTIVYDGEPHTLTAQVSNICSGDALTVSYTGRRNSSYGEEAISNSATAAGEYSITISNISGDAAKNYTLEGGANKSANLTINRQPVKITWTGDTTVEYDAAEHYLTASVVGQNDNAAVLFSYSDGDSAKNYKDANQYTYTVSSLKSDNYTLQGYTGEISNTLTINRQAVKITWTGDTTVEYDSTEHHLTATVVGKTDGAPVPFSYSDGDSAKNYKDANQYTYTVSSLKSDNYTLQGYEGEISATLTITQVVIQLEWDNQDDVTYYKGRSYSATATAKNICGADSIEFTYSISGTLSGNYTNNSAENVGEYKVSAVSVNNNNYTLNGTTDTDGGRINIKQQKVSITWDSDNHVYIEIPYDGKEHGRTATVKGADDNRNVEAEMSSGTHIDAASYMYYVQLTDSNYTLTGSTGLSSASMVIKPLAVQLSWSNPPTATYFMENGVARSQSAVATVENKVTRDGVGEDAVNVIEYTVNGSTGNSASKVGEYTVKAVQLDNKNYTLDGCLQAEDGHISITAQKVKITWEGAQRLVYDSQKHSLTAKVVGAEDGQEVSFNYVKGESNLLTQEQYSDASVYEYKIALKDSNYTLDGAEGNAKASLEISPKPVELAWTNSLDVYYKKGATYSATATVSNAYPSDRVLVETYQTAKSDGGTTAGSQASTVGTYTVSAMTLSSTNYTLTGCAQKDGGRITIIQQKVKITWTGDTDVVYDKTAHRLDAHVNGQEDNAEVAFSYVTNPASYVEEGSYTYTVASLSDDNYTLVGCSGSKTATLKINPKPIELTWTNESASSIYRKGHKVSATAKVTNFCSGDAGELKYDVSGIGAGNSAENVGEYVVSVTGIDNHNYTTVGCKNLSGGKISIVPQGVNILWADAKGGIGYGNNKKIYSYDGETHDIHITAITGVSDTSETVSYTLTKPTKEVRDAGQYIYTVKLTDDNYTLNGSVTKTVEITAKVLNIKWEIIGSKIGEDIKITLSAEGADELLASDGVTLTYTITNAQSKVTTLEEMKKTAGVYTLTAVLNGAKKGNYQLGTGKTSTCTISAAE